MKYILSRKLFEEFEGRNIYNIEHKNRFSVDKNLLYQGGWSIEYSSKLGKGRALIFDNTSTLKNITQLKDDEMYLFGIETTPSNSGVGRMFLKDIFDYFNINRIYLPSSDTHPVWNKIATKTNIESFNGLTLFTLDREQLFES